jgi:ATP-dependent Zn protease
MYLSGGSHGRTPAGPRWLSTSLIALAVFALVVFLVDKLILGPSTPPASLSSAIARLDKHEVRRVTIPARTMLIELNDGSKMTVAIPNDRDLGPIVRRSGADLALANAAETPLLGYVFQFVPFLVMAALLLFILRITSRRQMR